MFFPSFVTIVVALPQNPFEQPVFTQSVSPTANPGPPHDSPVKWTRPIFPSERLALLTPAPAPVRHSSLASSTLSHTRSAGLSSFKPSLSSFSSPSTSPSSPSPSSSPPPSPPPSPSRRILTNTSAHSLRSTEPSSSPNTTLPAALPTNINRTQGLTPSASISDAPAAPLYEIELFVTDRGVDVGTLDLWADIHEAFYSHADEGGVLVSEEYSTYRGNCTLNTDSGNLGVRYDIEGAWGSIGPFTPVQVRDNLFDIFWKNFAAITDRAASPTYASCVEVDPEYYYYQDNPNAACGPAVSTKCQLVPRCELPIVECGSLWTSHVVPARMELRVYEKATGNLRAESIKLSFASTPTDGSDSSQSSFICGNSKIEGLISSFIFLIPNIGLWVAGWLKFTCERTDL
ncbi:hypothetical protein PYCC9005_003294 [Savitreella phatthalungensis]